MSSLCRLETEFVFLLAPGYLRRFVCLTVNRITEKLLAQLSWDVLERCNMGQRRTHLKLTVLTWEGAGGWASTSAHGWDSVICSNCRMRALQSGSHELAKWCVGMREAAGQLGCLALTHWGTKHFLREHAAADTNKPTVCAVMFHSTRRGKKNCVNICCKSVKKPYFKFTKHQVIFAFLCSHMTSPHGFELWHYEEYEKSESVHITHDPL